MARQQLDHGPLDRGKGRSVCEAKVIYNGSVQRGDSCSAVDHVFHGIGCPRFTDTAQAISCSGAGITQGGMNIPGVLRTNC